MVCVAGIFFNPRIRPSCFTDKINVVYTFGQNSKTRYCPACSMCYPFTVLNLTVLFLSVHYTRLLMKTTFFGSNRFYPFYHWCLIAHASGFIIPCLHLDTSPNPIIFHHIDIDHVGTQSSSASCTMLMRPNKARTAVHGCWLLSFIFIFSCTNRVLSLLPMSP